MFTTCFFTVADKIMTEAITKGLSVKCEYQNGFYTLIADNEDKEAFNKIAYKGVIWAE